MGSALSIRKAFPKEVKPGKVGRGGSVHELAGRWGPRWEQLCGRTWPPPLHPRARDGLISFALLSLDAQVPC